MKNWILCLCVVSLFVLAGCGKQEKSPSEPLAEKTETTPGRLEIEGGLSRDLGTHQEHEVLDLTFVLRNAGGSPVVIESAFFSCPCGTMENPPDNLSLAPAETYSLKLKLHLSKIHLGEFTRQLSFEVKKGATVAVTMKGTNNQNFEVKPGRALYLGSLPNGSDGLEKEIEIIGTDPFVNGFKIPEQFSSGQFQCEAQEKAPGHYVVKLRPQTALPYTSHFSSSILVPIQEPADYPPLKIAVKGKIGTSVTFTPNRFVFHEDDFSAESSLVRTATFGNFPEEAKQNKQSGFFFIVPTADLKEIDWKKLFEKLTFDCPQCVTVEKELAEEGIRLHITVPRDAFASKRSFTITPRLEQNSFTKLSFALNNKRKPSE